MTYDRQTIYGQPPSKSNSYKIIKINGHRKLGKTAAMKSYEQSFFMQCGLRDKMVAKRFRLSVDVFFSSDRPDLDNCLKIILDCLQSCRAIKNDRLCSEIHARKLIDKVNPRVEIMIEEQL